jgi:hypothetical protein
MINCPKCYEEMPIKNLWDALGEECTCSSCGAIGILEYEETYDPESGEENGWFYFETMTA